MIDILAKFSLFERLSTDEIDSFLKNIRYQIKKYGENEIIYYSGAKCDNINLLLEGEVRGELFGENGKTIVVDIIYPYNSFAEAFVYSTEALFYVNVVAAKQSKVMIIDKTDFLKSLCQSTQLLNNYIRQISDRLVTLAKRIRSFSLYTIEAKIANFVLEKQKYSNDKQLIKIEMTHEQLADYFGVSRPALSRKLAELKSNNIVEFSHGKIKIINSTELFNLLFKEKTSN